MSYYDRSRQDSAPLPRRQKVARNWAASTALSNHQKAKLSILAKACWQIQVEAGIFDGTEKEFRHQQVEVATGKAGLTACSNADYRAIFAHFLKLQGNAKAAAAVYSKTGRVKGSQEVHDTHENRELAFHQIMRLIQISEGLITDAYADEMSRDMYSGRRIHELTASQLQSLLFTLVERLRAKRPDLQL
jgi:hypothetical protein